jgi:hypothetical protein
MTPSGLRRALTLALILATGSLLTAPPAWSTSSALFNGRVFQSDGVSARTGVIVALYDEETGDIFRSEPTNDEGVFAFDAVPAGTYALITEASEGAFLAGDAIELNAGANRSLSLTLSETPPDGTFAPAKTGGKGPSKLVSWIIAGSIIVVALLVLNEWTDDDERSSSDF